MKSMLASRRLRGSSSREMMIPSTEEVVKYMFQVPDARAVENLMDARVNTLPDNSRVLTIKGRFRANPCKL